MDWIIELFVNWWATFNAWLARPPTNNDLLVVAILSFLAFRLAAERAANNAAARVLDYLGEMWRGLEKNSN